MRKLAKQDSEEANEKLGEYFMEAHRLTSAQVCKRTVKANIESEESGNQPTVPKPDVILSLVSPPHQHPLLPFPLTLSLHTS